MGVDGKFVLGLDEDVVVELPGLQCYCHHHCPPGLAADESICRVGWGGRCFAAVEEVINPGTGHLEPEYSFGCFSAGDPAFLQCKGHLVNHHIPASILCCDGTDFCNESLRPIYRPSNVTGHQPYSPHSADYYLLQILLAAVLSLLVLTFVVILYLVCKYRAKERLEKGRKQEEGNRLVMSDSLNTSGVGLLGKAELGIDASSGSGSGLPLLVQRTIGRQIQLRGRIGKGRYGEVFLGEWGGTSVAVKSFLSMEDASWEREKQIYQLALMKHPNILVSMAWDIRSVESVTQMIIVTDYHSNGSLYDYLETRTLSEDEAFKLVLSVVAGLCHLHTEIEGKSYKPGVAHRDLKSKNILIKSDGEACLADFGLSVCSVQSKSEQQGVDKIPLNIKSGTKRYMPPELLDDTMKYQWFESYKQADMYSFALILWEIGSRCSTPSDDKKDEYEDYSVPFFSWTSNDPSYEEMKSLVCDRQVRPETTPRWERSKLLMTIARIMRECWHSSPHVRLTALRVKKTLYDLDLKTPADRSPHLLLDMN